MKCAIVLDAEEVEAVRAVLLKRLAHYKKLARDPKNTADLKRLKPLARALSEINHARKTWGLI